MDGGRDCHTTTQIFHTHTLSLTIQSLPTCPFRREWVVVDHTHTQSKGAFLTCVLSRYDVPVQRKLLKPGQGARRRYQLCLPLPVWVLEVPQLPLVDNETQPLCSTRPGTRFTDEWAGV